jgi:hypothetical protein
MLTEETSAMNADATAKPSSSVSIALAWLVVLIPAGWGVYLTVLRAANLFK